MKVKLTESPGAVHARLSVPLRNGAVVTVHAVVRHRDVVAYLRSRGIRLDAEMAGSFLGNIGKGLSKLTKLTAVKKALALGKALATSPLAQLIAPQVAVAIKAVEGGAKLMLAAKGGNPKAKAVLAAAKRQAAAETKHGKLPLPSGVAKASPDARAAYRYLVTLERVSA